MLENPSAILLPLLNPGFFIPLDVFYFPFFPLRSAIALAAGVIVKACAIPLRGTSHSSI